MSEPAIRPQPAGPEPSPADRARRPDRGVLAPQSGAARADRVGALCGSATRSRHALARLIWPVQAGFPSPAEDDQDPAIDLNALLAPHPEACFTLARARLLDGRCRHR